MICGLTARGQTFLPSPIQWLYPRGTPEALSSQPAPSAPQSLDSFRLKWREPALAGEGALLVGKALPRDKLLPSLPWAPNEIVGVHGDTLYVLSGAGWIAARLPLPPFLWDVSALLDTLAPVPRSYTSTPAIIALQSVERRSPDSLVTTFLVGAASADSLILLRRLLVDMRPYAPNLAAAIIPIAARSTPAQTLLYALVYTIAPADTVQRPVPYFRGLTQFASDSLLPAFPIANLPDDTSARLHYAPELWTDQPSLTQLPGGIIRLLLPFRADSARQTTIVNRIGHQTRADSTYLVGIDLQGNRPGTGIAPVPFPMDSSVRSPTCLPFWVRLQPDPTQGERPFILVAEGYPDQRHRGTARLHLYDARGLPLATSTLPTSPPFSTSAPHLWTLGIGNADHPPSNAAPPFYPNNPGSEILATPNTPARVVPGARLYVLRYRTDYTVPKPQPPGATLFPLDTIASAPCSGWLAAVADLTGNGRSEILLADRDMLQIWRLRDYSDPRFALGYPFDTLWSIRFPGEALRSVAIADIEGDGRADILVRTERALYCLGIMLQPAFTLLTPASDTTLCVTDTLRLRWLNLFRGHSPVSVLFQPYANGSPRGQPRMLVSAQPNDADTASLTLPARLLLPDTAGRLLIRSSTAPSARDSTPILHLRFPSLSLSTPKASDTLTVGDTLFLSGRCSCADSIRIAADNVPSDLHLRPDSSGFFTASLPVPCPPSASCWADLPPWRLRITAFADTFTATQALQLVRRSAPPPIPLQLFPEGICPEILLTWNPTDCPSPRVGYSTDGGRSFTELSPDVNSGSARYLLPAIPTDTVRIRLCCTNCSRADTLLSLLSPLTVHLLAPNPLQLPQQYLQIRYSFTSHGSARLRIVDAANNLISELVPWRSHQANSSYCETWDGTAHNGAHVPTGTYYLLIEREQRRWVFPIFVHRKP
ncbi:MAG: VCBS repeat-containing protein [Bacteroidota bacterium]|nr:VCBS repeat-containing protein [Bacteroidota bacterium]